MKKIERGALFVSENKELFRCPTCQQAITKVKNNSVFCDNNHQFDLSKKGTLYLLKHGVKSDYDDDSLWQARRTLLQHGLFDPIIAKISEQLDKKASNFLDIGCGEGSVLQRLEQLRKIKGERYIGFDISKKAINLATQQETNSFFCIADLADLPFKEQSFDYLIDIFSPSAYNEFDRVLKDHGKLLKVIPNANYLGELRRLLYAKDDIKYTYSNQKVRDLFYKHYPDAKEFVINYKFKLNDTLFTSLMKMTPLQWGENADLAVAKLHPLDEVTVDVTLLVAEKI